MRDKPNVIYVLAGRIRLGRNTPGAPQQNEGEALWDAIRWLEE
jgi:hypothetical protein